MEIIVGYILGCIVLLLFFITIFRGILSRLKSSNSELTERVANLEERVKELEKNN